MAGCGWERSGFELTHPSDTSGKRSKIRSKARILENRPKIDLKISPPLRELGDLDPCTALHLNPTGQAEAGPPRSCLHPDPRTHNLHYLVIHHDRARRAPLWAGSGNLLNGGPYTWHVTDQDQRRHFAVTYDPPSAVEDVEGTEEICIAQLRKHIDDLGHGVFGIRFTQPDGPITLLTDRKHDVTLYVNNYPLSALGLPFPLKTIYWRSLTELDRVGPYVDIVSYPGPPCVAGTAVTPTKVAFKYWYMQNGMLRIWYELNSWSRLPRDHPHIVPFDAVVLDHHTDSIVGFTTQYIPGGTLQENNARTRPFRLQWLRQLLSVVDDLNYRYGMMHQDIAARNLLVDERDKLRIFDFNYSIMIEKHYSPERDDIKGVIFTLYEIITLDEHFREVPHAEQDAEAVLNMKWEKHPDVKLDADVQMFRDVLDSWVAERRAKEFFKPTDTWLRWPEMPTPPTVVTPTRSRDGELTGTQMKSVVVVRRKDYVDMGRRTSTGRGQRATTCETLLLRSRQVRSEPGGAKRSYKTCRNCIDRVRPSGYAFTGLLRWPTTYVQWITEQWSSGGT